VVFFYPGKILGTHIPDTVLTLTLTTALQMSPKKCKSWDKLQMLNAITAARDKEMTLMQGLNLYEVLRSVTKHKVNSGKAYSYCLIQAH
jgi:hypothetical protein